MASAAALIIATALVASFLVTLHTKEPFKANVPNAWATFHYYDELGTGDGSPYGATACADRPITKAQLKKHPWVAVNPKDFGLSNDGTKFRPAACGQCIEVKRKNGKKQVFTVVDMKGAPGVDLSHHGFKKLGMRDNEYVSVKKVKC
jgi:hypothetical protein